MVNNNKIQFKADISRYVDKLEHERNRIKTNLVKYNKTNLNNEDFMKGLNYLFHTRCVSMLNNQLNKKLINSEDLAIFRDEIDSLFSNMSSGIYNSNSEKYKDFKIYNTSKDKSIIKSHAKAKQDDSVLFCPECSNILKSFGEKLFLCHKCKKVFKLGITEVV